MIGVVIGTGILVALFTALFFVMVIEMGLRETIIGWSIVVVITGLVVFAAFLIQAGVS